MSTSSIPPTTPLIPPTSTPGGPDAPRPRRTAGRVIAILVAVLGIGVLVGTLWSGMRPTFSAASARTESRTQSVTGVDDVVVDASAARVTVSFDDDADAARLDVRDSGGGSWTFERDGGTLRVASPGGAFRWGFGADNGSAELVLPSDLAAADISLGLAGGSLTAAGDFGAVQLQLAAGQATLTGSAQSLTAQVDAGRADLDLADVRAAALTLSAGEVRGGLTGQAPDDVRIDVSAGSLTLDLPDAPYAVTSDVSAGGFDNRLRTDSEASARVHVEVSAGNATLRAG